MKMFWLIQVLVEMICESEQGNETNHRMWWVHPMNQRRGVGPRGEFHSQVKELHKYPDRFYQYFWMIITKFDELLNLVKKQIRKENTNWWHSITVEERLAVCLRCVSILIAISGQLHLLK